MRRILSLLLCLSLLCGMTALAAAPEEERWTRSEGDGAYVTIRVPFEEGEGMKWADSRYLCVRYADTKQPVPLTSDYMRQALYATVPADQAGRPLEVFQGEVFHFYDTITVWKGTEYYDTPQGADDLYIRGVVKGDGAGNLNAGAVISRAEAFTLLARLMSLEPGGDPGYADVKPGDWYYDAASAARAAGIAAADTKFNPQRPVTRGEFTVMLCRAMRTVGWLGASEGTAADLNFVDAAEIPDWALDAYLAFAPHNLDIHTNRETGEAEDGGPLYEALAEPGRGATRGEVIGLMHDALRFLPVYPTQTAIDWGFDREMPVIDGSTSTYPYTQAVYGTLFSNYDNHPQYPQSHSKSYYSYDRLISGEADILFISTKPTQDTLDKARAAGVELELIPIAYDAMVFFTNPQNSAAGLTSEQIRRIYVDNAYTNWKELGGPDAAFVPYCRNMDSGSQAQMEEFFLRGAEIHPDIRRETTSVSMASVLTDVEGACKADPPTYALGYSIFYYYRTASQILLGEDGLKLLAVDGVVPTDATIADGSYPLSGYNYAVVRADEPEDSPARRMAAFMRSEEGQNCVSNAGFGPLALGVQADFAAQMPGWTVYEAFPAGDGYVILAWDKDDSTPASGRTLLACRMEQKNGAWTVGEKAECKGPASPGFSARVLRFGAYTLVYGAVDKAFQDGAVPVNNRDAQTVVRLLYDGGAHQSQILYTGSTFRFLLEGEHTLEDLVFLQGDQTVARYSETFGQLK